MNNLNIKPFVYIIVAFSILAFLILFLIGENSVISILVVLKIIPNVVTIDLFIILIFSKWLWKIKLFRGWLVPFDDLNGTWIGSIQSSWIDEKTGVRCEPIPVMLTVRQSFFNISCKMSTIEMTSSSFVERFVIDNERQVKKLIYSYTSKPRVLLENRSLPHDGTVIFDVISIPTRQLVGKYWTDRKTIGEMLFDYHSKELLESLPEEYKKHPLSTK